jgi:hypothetical protein
VSRFIFSAAQKSQMNASGGAGGGMISLGMLGNQFGYAGGERKRERGLIEYL